MQISTRAFFGLLAVPVLMLSLVGCAGGPTSSPENAARAFLDAMKNDSLEAALSVFDPTTGPLVDESEVTVTLSDAEHAASAPTGVTGFEIINQTVSDSGVATVTAELAGGSVSQLTLSVRQGGPSGEDWLVYGVEPQFSFVEVPEWMTTEWSLQLAEDTSVPAGTERILMLPGSVLTDATITDANGFFGPAAVQQRDGRLVDAGLFVVTDEGGAAAHAHHMEYAGRLVDEMLTFAKENPDYVRVITEPAFEVLEFEKESDSPTIRTDIRLTIGEFQQCVGARTSLLPWADLEYTMRSFSFFTVDLGDEIEPGSGSTTVETIEVFDPRRDALNRTNFRSSPTLTAWVGLGPKLSDCE